ncbi:unnamed protein product [Nippostrongylus brasiliensis]|uniref:Anoctamin n=1 Tax=Nippostrongylus brasiliensis TaxID=27835 RepID=A0A0N4YXN3_NIPBR|nr:unnamed protein product [Nippostrongylus brasiliensis]
MENTFEDSFILHEPSEVEPYFRKMKENSFVTYVEMMNEIETDPRKKLGDLWTRKEWNALRFARFQPLNTIREYFGEQIAFYFAWQGTFLTVLWPATIFGLVVFVFGLQKRLAQFFTMVSSWFMKSFDNELNAFFAAFMSVWGTLFYQIWRRNNAVLAYEWDCEDVNVVEPDRPEYRGSSTRTDPITGETEYFSPQMERFFKLTASCIIVALSMCLVVISVILVTLYKLWAVSKLGCDKEVS